MNSLLIVIGALLLAAPFVVAVGASVQALGWKQAAAIWGISITALCVVAAGAVLFSLGVTG